VRRSYILIYLPVYSNGLKDMAASLGLSGPRKRHRTADHSLAEELEQNKSRRYQAHLLQYNQDDCRALKHVVESIDSVISSDVPPLPGHVRRSVINTQTLRQASCGLTSFGKSSSPCLTLICQSIRILRLPAPKDFRPASTSLKRILTKSHCEAVASKTK